MCSCHANLGTGNNLLSCSVGLEFCQLLQLCVTALSGLRVSTGLVSYSWECSIRTCLGCRVCFCWFVFSFEVWVRVPAVICLPLPGAASCVWLKLTFIKEKLRVCDTVVHCTAVQAPVDSV